MCLTLTYFFGVGIYWYWSPTSQQLWTSTLWHWCTADFARCSRWPADSGSPRHGHHHAGGPIWWAEGQRWASHHISPHISFIIWTVLGSTTSFSVGCWFLGRKISTRPLTTSSSRTTDKGWMDPCCHCFSKFWTWILERWLIRPGRISQASRLDLASLMFLADLVDMLWSSDAAAHHVVVVKALPKLKEVDRVLPHLLKQVLPGHLGVCFTPDEQTWSNLTKVSHVLKNWPAFGWADNGHGMTCGIFHHQDVFLITDQTKHKKMIDYVCPCVGEQLGTVEDTVDINDILDSTLYFRRIEEWFMIFSVSAPSRGTTTIPKSPTITSIWNRQQTRSCICRKQGGPDSHHFILSNK